MTEVAPATRLGTTLASAGDVNRDGILDVIVGAPRTNTGSPATGAVRVLSGLDGSQLYAWNGVTPSSWFGSAVDGGQDFNDDGAPDLLIGAPLGSQSAGHAYVYSGLNGAQLASYSGRNAGDEFGAAACFLGDVNDDGQIDLAVGAPHANGSGWNAGEVLVLSGADGSELYRIEGQNADFLGFDLACVGDLDGDCVAELLVGAPFSDTSGFNAGSAYVYSGASGALLLTLHGAAPGDWFGSRVASLGDVNGDGTPDLGIGVPGSDRGGFDSGAVEVRSGTDGSLLFAVAGEAPAEYMQAVSGLGDVDGDGFREWVVGSASADGGGQEGGRVRIISGIDGQDYAYFDGGRLQWFGAAVVGLENPTGRIDLAVGAPAHDDHPELHGYVKLLRATRLKTAPVPPPIEDDCK